MKNTKDSKNMKKITIISILLIALIYCCYLFVGHLRYEKTDNAQVEGHIYQVNPKIGGQVLEVLVDDNEYVEKGQVLARIDRSDIELIYAQAKAGLAQIQAEKAAALAAVEASKAASRAAFTNIAVVKAKKKRLSTDLVRFTNLRNDDIIPQSKIDDINTNFDVVTSQVTAAQQQYNASNGQYNASFQKISSIDAAIEAAKVQVQNAELKLSYTEIKAPASGVVSRKMIEAGQVIGPGQPLMAITDFSELWIVANFKEGQVAKMAEGQNVEIKIDAFSNKNFAGKIESIAAATGAKFSLFPADNATGNFTKVTQRIPVKILFDENEIKDEKLRAGMSAVIKVINK
ncbi:membrane fusion protein, multidrug efflux system [Maribacter dokdonensis]|uniref:Membrane fusion protein, multidrug efflux system n=1 Tax=Maribacter dokdonensis TaxID=320912 RepID=A0ABY0UMM9_9FLAO|nr:HlyD family secretion protein [Maribacter dokdonensis]SDS91774.1 membrane fusion protein, multidrug efflux system [Maribacter dokdonensis]